ncbi:MAG: hypothetical protein H6R15_363 [Proteobacteria bacterium]|nr:hypothetical protein [Pseudomonadota bacterium]
MIKTYWLLLGALFALVSCHSAAAEEVAGMVKNSRGLVTIERGGEKMAATVGVPVRVADKLRTGADGAVGITLRDNTLLSAGPNSLISIDKFAFDTTSLAGNMSVGIRRGTLSVASGKIAKQTPESVDFRTPTSVLGVRGTEFAIEVGDGDAE